MPNPQQTYKQGELYWCDPDPKLVDTVGSEQKGDRVWLIVSVEHLHRGNCVVALPASRHTEKGGIAPHLIEIPSSEITMVDGSPLMDRLALTDQIRCLNKTRLRKKAGYISRRAVFATLIGLDKLFGRVYPPKNSN